MVGHPASGVKHLTPERCQSGNVRNIRFGERSDPRDQDVTGQLAVVGVHLPAAPGMIPRGVEYIVMKTDIATEAVAVDAVAQVVPNLLLSGEAAAPRRV